MPGTEEALRKGRSLGSFDPPRPAPPAPHQAPNRRWGACRDHAARGSGPAFPALQPPRGAALPGRSPACHRVGQGTDPPGCPPPRPAALPEESFPPPRGSWLLRKPSRNDPGPTGPVQEELCPERARGKARGASPQAGGKPDARGAAPARSPGRRSRRPGGAPGPGAAREGPAGWPGAAAGTRAGQGPAARRSSPRPRPDRGCRRRVRAAGAGWEPRSPRPRPRDGHALWPLRDSPPQRPRLSQAHRGQLPRAQARGRAEDYNSRQAPRHSPRDLGPKGADAGGAGIFLGLCQAGGLFGSDPTFGLKRL